LPNFSIRRIGDCVGFHRGRLADAKDIPAALTTGDFVGVTSGHDVELSPFGRHPHHRERDRRVYVADNKIGVIVVDQLMCFRDPGAAMSFDGIRDEELHFAAENAAAPVNLLDRKLGAGNFSFSEACVNRR
jgi:hypothetical protein